MARIVKEEEYAEKRNAILGAAQRLVFTKGYEQMTIQDILDDLQISKGAFYHYFDSKQAVLEALIIQMLDDMEQLLLPIVHDPVLPVLEKLQRFFAAVNQRKIAQKELLLAMLGTWYADHNALVRQKMLTVGSKRLLPLFTQIIHQGVQEGILRISYPEEVGEVVLSLGQALGDTLGRLLLSLEREEGVNWSQIERIVAAYTDAIERVLGAPAGSLLLTDTLTLQEWFSPPAPANSAN